jgi:hypothetical protein
MATGSFREPCHGGQGGNCAFYWPNAHYPHGLVRNNPQPNNTMILALESLHPLKVIAVALVCFLVGGLWYSPLLFVKPWLKEMKITPEMIAERGKAGMPRQLILTFLLTIVSTYTLAALLAAHNTTSACSGAELGLFVGLGIYASRTAVNGLFECRTLKHYMITTGHDLVVFTLQGAVLALWR